VPVPSLGQVVHYTLSGTDAGTINGKRVTQNVTWQQPVTITSAGMPMTTSFGAAAYDFGGMKHAGNEVREGDVFPALVVRIWPTSVNLQVFLDGNDTYWATSRLEASISGDSEEVQPGTWAWPRLDS
jgi:hypothetical protein